MVAYTDSIGFYKGTAAYPEANGRCVSKIEVTLDFAKIAAARVAVGATALTTSDTLEVIRLPANTMVLAAGLEVVTAGTGNCDLDFGFTGGTADLFVTDLPLDTVGIEVAALAAPYIVGAADTIDVLFVAAAPGTAGVVRAFAIVVDLN
jgi:hypothetical protein